jgi:hypothetical protein
MFIPELAIKCSKLGPFCKEVFEIGFNSFETSWDINEDPEPFKEEARSRNLEENCRDNILSTYKF